MYVFVSTVQWLSWLQCDWIIGYLCVVIYDALCILFGDQPPSSRMSQTQSLILFVNIWTYLGYFLPAFLNLYYPIYSLASVFFLFSYFFKSYSDSVDCCVPWWLVPILLFRILLWPLLPVFSFYIFSLPASSTYPFSCLAIGKTVLY